MRRAATYLRFAGLRTDPDSGVPEGIFCALGSLKASGDLSDGEREALDECSRWFAENLAVPTRFGRRSRNPSRAEDAICWVDASAREHVRWFHVLAGLLRHHGVFVRVLRLRKKPGYVVYEDAHQVAAVPFRDTPV
jgi:hypothetical protein